MEETDLNNSSSNPTHSASSNHRIAIADGATPYRLTISAFFPRPALPGDNPLTDEGVALGRKLFFDPQLSINDSQSCASCTDPAKRSWTAGA